MDSTFTVYIGDQSIETTVTANSHTITSWIQAVDSLHRSTQTVIAGLDIEWRPNRLAGSSNPAATLQICVGNRCLIIQLIYIDRFPPALRRFLANPRYKLAGVEIAADAAKLNQDYGLVCANLYDLRDAAAATWPDRFSHRPGLSELAWSIANLTMEKPKRVTLSDWARQVLTWPQIEYACADAYASCRVGEELFFGS